MEILAGNIERIDGVGEKSTIQSDSQHIHDSVKGDFLNWVKESPFNGDQTCPNCSKDYDII